jgi:hypothetical protein
MIRGGKVVVIPHYINSNGPRGAVDPTLKAWYGFRDAIYIAKALEASHFGFK